MWHIIKAEFYEHKSLFLIWNLVLGLVVLAYAEFHLQDLLGKMFKPIRLAGIFSIIPLAMLLIANRAREKRNWRHCLLPIPLQSSGIARLGATMGFWTCLLFWIHTGIYLTQDVVSHALFIKEAGYTLAIAVTFNALIHITQDQMANIKGHPKIALHPLTLIIYATFLSVLMILFLELSFEILGLQMTPVKTFFLASTSHVVLLLFACIAISYISSLLFAKRRSYLV
jgi:hypothetical protein